MMPVIRIPDAVYERLQKYATPFVDTPATVIERLLDVFESKQHQDNLTPMLLPASRSTALVEEEKQQDSEERTTPTWSGFWFVNVGEDAHRGEAEHRNWDDCVKYRFLAAGWERSINQLKNLTPGSKVFAYMSGRGYVGYGEVVRQACPAKEFIPEGHTESILDLPLQAEDMDHDRDDLDQCEWVVGVKWHTTFSRDEAKRFTDIFAKQHTVCRLRDQRTLTFLLREFNVQPAEVE
jgi:hypothetical protein